MFFSIFCRKLFQVLQMRMDFLRKCHLKNLSMVLWGPRPLALLEGEEGESRLVIKSTQTKKQDIFSFFVITSLVDIVVKSYYFTYSTWNMQRPQVNSFYSNNLDQAVSPFGFAFTCLFWQETGSVCKQKQTLMNMDRKKTNSTIISSLGEKKNYIYWGGTQLQHLFGDIKSAISEAGLFKRKPGCSSL